LERTPLTLTLIEKQSGSILENMRKRITGKSKQQKKKTDIHECLVEEGYDISYSTICNYIKSRLNESLILASQRLFEIEILPSSKNVSRYFLWLVE
jgi:hypothetical protein